ncbi:MAG: hypothetical protein ABIF11_02380 [Nitrospirota bacterium]
MKWNYLKISLSLTILLVSYICGCANINNKLAQNQFENAQNLQETKSYTSAIKEYQQIINKYPNTIRANKAKEKISECKTEIESKRQFELYGNQKIC